MKDFIKSKIDEARESGRDVPAVIEELIMHLADGMDGNDPEKKKDPEPIPAPVE